MPKACVDYSNTIIYKIVCKDPNVSDIYVGHTTNFTQRKYTHKIACNKLIEKPDIYNVIRQTGGWDNWEMVEIGRYNCKNHKEAKIKEHYHLKCILNKDVKINNASNTNNEIVVNYKQSFFDSSESDVSNDDLELNVDNFGTFIDTSSIKDGSIDGDDSYKFICEFCDYKTNRNSQYDRHIETSKHIENMNKKLIVKTYKCVCGRKYTHRQSLSVHKKLCNYKEQEETSETKNSYEPLTTEIVMELIKQNKNLQEMLHEQYNKMYEIAKEKISIKPNSNTITTTNNNTTNNTTNNNQFNLNVFLNETCKDAINMSDFIDSLNVKLQDLEYTAKTSYVEGISKIFINGLTSLNIPDRPLHCSDSKRDVIYIKDHDIWEKDDEHKTKLTKAIKLVGHKNMKQISEWQKAYPEYKDPESKQNDKYMKMLCNAMCGSTKEETERNYEKIIKNIVKEVVIDKEAFR